MQTISDNILSAVVSENGAQLIHLKNQQDDDFIKLQADQGGYLFLRPQGKKTNVLEGLSWTVVDKGDARVSLMAIDNEKSREIFPYHFEYMVTLRLLGSQLQVEVLLTNNSQRAFSCQIACQLNILAGKMKLAAGDFAQVQEDPEQLLLTTDTLDLASGQKRQVAFSLTA